MATAMIEMFLCFGIVSVVWLRQRRRMRINKRIEKEYFRQKETNCSFLPEAGGRNGCGCHCSRVGPADEDYGLAPIHLSAQQKLGIYRAWDDQEWKRNFCVSRTTFSYSCNKLCSKLWTPFFVSTLRHQWEMKL